MSKNSRNSFSGWHSIHTNQISMNDINNHLTNRITGSILAHALGDAFGAPHEGGIFERGLWRLIGKRKGKRCWTDDTQMSINVIESLLSCGRVDQDDLACRFARSYQWRRGYGPGAAKMLKRIRRGQPWQEANRTVFRDGSFGNGGAMRAAPIGLFFAAASEEELVQAARTTAAVTHGHPLGQEGAALIALATGLTCNDVDSEKIIQRLSNCATTEEFQGKLKTAGNWLKSESTTPTPTVAAELGNGIAAINSCVTAIYIALSFRDAPFDELLDFTISLGGDVDTIAAMAGGIWGAGRGLHALPEKRLQQLEQCDRLTTLARSLAENIGATSQ